MDAIKAIRTKNFSVIVETVDGENLLVIVKPRSEEGKLLTRFKNFTRNKAHSIAATALVTFACGLETKLAQLAAL